MAAWSLRRRTEQTLGAEIIWLHGEIDLSNAHQVHDRLLELGTNGRHLVLDLSGLTFLDVSGVRSLEMLSESCRAAGVRFLLTGPSPLVRRVLDILQLQTSLPVFENWEAAARHLRYLTPGGH